MKLPFQIFLIVLVACFSGCATTTATKTDSKSKIPIAGVARYVNENDQYFFLELFFPAEFYSVPTAEDFEKTAEGKNITLTLPFNRNVAFYDVDGLIWDSFPMPFVSQKIWCTQGPEKRVASFLRISVPKESFPRMKLRKDQMDSIVAVAVAHAAEEKVDLSNVMKIRILEGYGSSTCPNRQLRLSTPWGNAALTCCAQ